MRFLRVFLSVIGAFFALGTGMLPILGSIAPGAVDDNTPTMPLVLVFLALIAFAFYELLRGLDEWQDRKRAAQQ